MPPCRGDTLPGTGQGFDPHFNPRPLARATQITQEATSNFLISIYAPLRGRPVAMHSATKAYLFQSTPPCGDDPPSARIFFGILTISIHAPIRGRPSSPPSVIRTMIFQSTPPYGDDLSLFGSQSQLTRFQSTPPYGDDHGVRVSFNVNARFQSTPPCGGDANPPAPTAGGPDFNPRPHAGATKGTSPINTVF